MSRLNTQHELDDRGRVNYSLQWWRSFFGVNSTIGIHLSSFCVDDKDQMHKRAKKHWKLTWKELAALDNAKDVYTVNSIVNYSNLSKTEALIFDDSRFFLSKIYLDYLKNRKLRESEEVVVLQYYEKYQNFKTLSRDVFNKAKDEIVNYGKIIEE
ncbi:hypothetical protein [Vibrio parahaemolyticus]